jgi:hypothetical protein
MKADGWEETVRADKAREKLICTIVKALKDSPLR